MVATILESLTSLVGFHRPRSRSAKRKSPPPQERKLRIERAEDRLMLADPQTIPLPDFYSTPSSTQLTATAQTGVRKNDTAVDDAPITITKLTDPAQGNFSSFGTDGSFVYVPGADGVYSFTYKATANGVDSAAVTAQIAVGKHLGPRTNLVPSPIIFAASIE